MSGYQVEELTEQEIEYLWNTVPLSMNTTTYQNVKDHITSYALVKYSAIINLPTLMEKHFISGYDAYGKVTMTCTTCGAVVSFRTASIEGHLREKHYDVIFPEAKFPPFPRETWETLLQDIVPYSATTDTPPRLLRAKIERNIKIIEHNVGVIQEMSISNILYYFFTRGSPTNCKICHTMVNNQRRGHVIENHITEFGYKNEKVLV